MSIPRCRAIISRRPAFRHWWGFVADISLMFAATLEAIQGFGALVVGTNLCTLPFDTVWEFCCSKFFAYGSVSRGIPNIPYGSGKIPSVSGTGQQRKYEHSLSTDSCWSSCVQKFHRSSLQDCSLVCWMTYCHHLFLDRYCDIAVDGCEVVASPDPGKVPRNFVDEPSRCFQEAQRPK